MRLVQHGASTPNAQAIWHTGAGCQTQCGSVVWVLGQPSHPSDQARAPSTGWSRTSSVTVTAPPIPTIVQIQLAMADNYLQAVPELVGHQTIVLDQQDMGPARWPT